jgi:F-type H+-transporting ATPase subunit b
MSVNVAVLVGFLLFFAIVFWYRIPSLIGGMLDKRADGIRADLDEARMAREEAQKLLAKIERDTADTKNEADKIIEGARKGAEATAEQAKIDLHASIERKMKTAEERIAQAEASAIREIRNAAAGAAVAAASEVLGTGIDGSKSTALIDDGINQVGDLLH